MSRRADAALVGGLEVIVRIYALGRSEDFRPVSLQRIEAPAARMM